MLALSRIPGARGQGPGARGKRKRRDFLIFDLKRKNEP
jgi:hypothetical protein